MSLIEALTFKWAHRECSVANNDPQQITWHDDQPAPTQQEIADAVAEFANAKAKQQQIEQIKTELEELDRKSIRPLRDGESSIVADLASQAAALRLQLNALEEA